MESVEVVLNLVGGLIDSEGVAGLRVGEEFEVSFTAVDLRADSRNTVYSFYTDVAFDPTVLRAVSVEYNDELATGGGYQFAQSGNINNVAGRIEDVGATSGQVVSSEALSPVVFTVRFELLKAAPVLIETDVPETLIAQTTVYGLDEDQRDAVRYGSLSLEVPQANPVVSIEATDFGAAEPNDDGAFTLTRTGDTSEALSVELAIAGSAINGADYETISQTVTFAAGASSVAVPVLVFDDSLVEDVETVVLTLVDGAQYDLDAGNSATVTIASNDAVRSVVTIEATDAIASESGDGGSFTITRTGDLTGFLPITLNVSGTATNGEDYEAILSLVTIAAGESSIEIPISVIDDSLVEPVETVVVELASSVLYDLGASSSAVLTIESDDAVLPVVAIAATDATAAEPGDNGAFTITRTGDVTESLEVVVQVNGTAANGEDYRLIDETVTIAAGFSAVEVPVSVLDDGLVEDAETVVVTLVDGGLYDLGANSSAALAIESDDVALAVVTIVATDADAAESVSGTDGGRFTITRTGDLTSALEIALQISGTATNGEDYQTILSTIAIAANESSVDVPVSVLDDALVEVPETVVVTLASGSLYEVGASASATVTIESEDTVVTPMPVVTVETTDATTAEPGDNGAFTITRTGDVTDALEVTLLVEGSATNGADYQMIGESFTIAAGASSVEVPVSVIDDALVEEVETVVITLVDGERYELGASSSAALTIESEDAVIAPTPVVSVTAADANANETGDRGLFTISRAGDSDSDLEVQFAIAGNANNGVDYQAVSLSATIAAGESSVDVAVDGISDSLSEGSETVVLTLADTSLYDLGAETSATVTIADTSQAADTSEPVVSVEAVDAIAREPNDDALFVVSRTGSLDKSLRVRLSAMGDASNGRDYDWVPKNVTIAAGESRLEVPVRVRDDDEAESDETIVLSVVENKRYEIGTSSSAIVTIVTAAVTSPVVSVTATDANANETGDRGLFTISRVGDSDSDLEVQFAIAGSANNGVDYQAVSLSATIAAGESSVDVAVDGISDSLSEGSETVVLTLADTSLYDLGAETSATVTIADTSQAADTSEPVVSVEAVDAIAREPNDDALFVVSRTGSLDKSLRVRLSAMGDASNGRDYDWVPKNVTIAAGESRLEVPVRVRDDDEAEADETIVLSVVKNRRYEIGTSSSATVTIEDSSSASRSSASLAVTSNLAPRAPLAAQSTAQISDSVAAGSAAANGATAESYPSAEEQYLLELANRFRLNPAAEYDKLVNSGDAQVNEAIGFFGVDLDVLLAQWSTLEAVQPLAWSEQLSRSATTHNQLMIDFDQQSHDLPGEPDLATRIEQAGNRTYQAVGENIYAFAESPFFAHAGFAVDWGDDDNNSNNGFGTGIQPDSGHRVNLLTGEFNEAGFSILSEDEPSTEVGPLVVTQHFGGRGTGQSQWLVGAAFQDLDDDNFYSVGEGLSDVVVNISGAGFSTSVETGFAGGYQTVLPTGTYALEFVRDGQVLQTLENVVIDDQNVKKDLMVEVGSAPNSGLGKITGIQFDDVNGNGVQDIGELALAGRSLFLDTNGNRQRDGAEQLAITDENGVYIFNNLSPGDYRVTPVVPVGRVQTLPNPDFPLGSETYQLDDGEDEGWTAFTRGNDTLIFNQFETVNDSDVLTSLSVWLSSRGNPTQLFVYQDADGDGRPDGDERLLSVSPTLVGEEKFVNVAIDPTTVSGTFFVGALYEGDGSRNFTLIPRDRTTPAGKSWRAVSSDPDDFSASLSATSNWLLRANTEGVLANTVSVSANETVGGVNFGDSGDATPLPSLVATALDVTNDHILAGQVDLSFSLTNEGAGDVDSFEVGVVYSDDEIIGNGDDVIVDVLTLGGLTSGESLSRNVTVQLSREGLNSRAQADDVTGLGEGYVSTSRDYIGILIDPNNLLAPGSTSAPQDATGIDKDDVTYFPWDVDNDGTVTLDDIDFVVNRLGQTVPPAEALADFDGNGLVTATDSLSAINRLGYEINSSVFEA